MGTNGHHEFMIEASTPAAELEAKRQRLAWELAQGHDVEDALTMVEDQLGRLQRQAQRDALAQAEAEQQAIDARTAQLEAERQAQLEQLKAATAAQIGAAGDVETAVDLLCRALDAYLRIGKERYRLSGGAPLSTSGQRHVEAYLAWKIGEVMPRLLGPKPSHEQRVPLVQALRGAQPPEAE